MTVGPATADRPTSPGTHPVGRKVYKWLLCCPILGLFPFLIDFINRYSQHKSVGLSELFGHGELYILSTLAVIAALGELIFDKRAKVDGSTGIITINLMVACSGFAFFSALVYGMSRPTEPERPSSARVSAIDQESSKLNDLGAKDTTTDKPQDAAPPWQSIWTFIAATALGGFVVYYSEQGDRK